MRFGNLDWYLMWDVLIERYMEILTITIVTFSLTLSDAKTYADETDRPFSGTREMVSLSIANVVSPFAGSYVAGAGISRSAVAFGMDQTDNLTQVYSIISAIVVLLAIPCIHAIAELPQAVLAAVVLMALNGAMGKQSKKCGDFWKFGRRDDFVTWFATLCTTVFVDLDYGLLVGLLSTVHSVFLRLNQAKLTTLGKVQDTQFFDDVSKGLTEYPGVKVIRLNSPLFFGSKDQFYNQVRLQVDAHAQSLADKPHSGIRHAVAAVPYHTLVIDASGMIFLDTAGAQQLATLSIWLRRNHNARLLVACGNDIFVDVFRRVDFDLNDGEEVLFPSVHSAVLYGASLGVAQGRMSLAPIAKVHSMPHFHDNKGSSGWLSGAGFFGDSSRHATGEVTQYTPLLNPGRRAVENPSFYSSGRISADPVMDEHSGDIRTPCRNIRPTSIDSGVRQETGSAATFGLPQAAPSEHTLLEITITSADKNSGNDLNQPIDDGKDQDERLSSANTPVDRIFEGNKQSHMLGSSSRPSSISHDVPSSEPSNVVEIPPKSPTNPNSNRPDAWTDC